MALRKAIVDIPLNGGLSEHIDDLLSDPPLLESASNIRFDKKGGVRKRKGVEPFSGTSLPTSTDGVNTLLEHENRPAVLGVDGLYNYSDTEDAWVEAEVLGTAPVGVEQFVDLFVDGDLLNYDVAVNQGYLCEVWKVDGNVWYQIRDITNEAVLLPPTQTSLEGDPRVETHPSNNKFFIFGYNNTTDLRVSIVDPATAYTEESNVLISNSVDAYDVDTESSLSAIFVIERDSATSATTSLHSVDGSGTVTASLGLGASMDSDHGLGLFVSNQFTFSLACDNGSVSVSRVDLDLDVGSQITQTGILTISGDDTNTTWEDNTRLTASSMANGDILIAASAVDDPTSPVCGSTVWATATNSLSKNSEEYLIPNMIVACKAFSPGPFDDAVVPLEYYFKYDSDDFNTVNQPAVLLVRMDLDFLDSQSGNPVGYPIVMGRIFNDIAANRKNETFHLGQVVQLQASGKWVIPSTIVSGTLVTGSSYWSPHAYGEDRPGIRIASSTPVNVLTDATSLLLDFDPGPVTSVNYNDLVATAGSMFCTYDGVGYTEGSIHFFPEIHEMNAENTGVTNLAEGDYRLRAVFVVEDANGNKHRSSPSLPLSSPTVTLSGALRSIRVRITRPPITHFRTEHGRKIRVQLYSTDVDSTGPFNLVKEVDLSSDTVPSGKVFNNNLGTILWDGSTITQDVIANNPALYTTGGVLASEAPPPFISITSTPDRIFGINAEYPWEVWASKFPSVRTAPEWNKVLLVPASPKHSFTALGSMDEHVILTSEDRVFIISGKGPNDLGEGTWDGPTLLSSDTGCTNRRTMVEGPFGVMFQGHRGFYLVDRGLNLRYIGSPEDTLDTLTINSAVLVPDEHEIRFSSDEDTMLVYHYAEGQWSTRDQHCVHTSMVNNEFYQVKNTSGGWAVLKERDDTDTSFEDSGTLSDGSTGIDNYMSLTTTWIKLSGLQGYVSLWRIHLLGEKLDSADLIVSLAYDYDDTTVDSFRFEDADMDETRLRLRVKPSRRRAQAVKVTLQEVTHIDLVENDSNATEAFRWSGLSLEYGVNPGLSNQIPPRHSL